jgi:hypothetical protein
VNTNAARTVARAPQLEGKFLTTTRDYPAVLATEHPRTFRLDGYTQVREKAPSTSLLLIGGQEASSSGDGPILLGGESQAQDRVIPLQKWEGMVISISGDSLIARLIDRTHPGPDEEVEFALEEVPPADLSLVKPGAIFYWNIAYVDDAKTGQRTRASSIRFRRLPVWSQQEIVAAEREAEEMRRVFGWR